ncbi:MAG TPA: 2-phospho-L-lactate transferase CofD family protein, partial [Anaerolineales bacterium]|nr:2-phospho-L-lactate transferase CofD family protein [Anaerolineales bacterium]
GLANPETGWGRVNETWQAISNIERLGGPIWFRLGDQDLATHIERTRRLKEGQYLSEITKDFCTAWGIKQAILPMTDQAVRTIVETEEGDLAFQEYFVHRRCEPRVKGFRFDGIENAQAAPGVREAIRSADVVIICPSNPWVSIDPILAIARSDWQSNLRNKKVIAVSPIIGGKAIKGPAAKMYKELGIEPSAFAVAKHYEGIASGFVLDKIDSQLGADIRSLNMQTLVANTLMKTMKDRRKLAEDVLDFVGHTL